MVAFHGSKDLQGGHLEGTYMWCKLTECLYVCSKYWLLAYRNVAHICRKLQYQQVKPCSQSVCCVEEQAGTFVVGDLETQCQV